MTWTTLVDIEIKYENKFFGQQTLLNANDLSDVVIRTREKYGGNESLESSVRVILIDRQKILADIYCREMIGKLDTFIRCKRIF